MNSDFQPKVLYKDGEPCKHPGCRSHISHPCEGCGRIGARGVVYENIFIEEYLQHVCGDCGQELQIVRPGKYQCVNPKCESICPECKGEKLYSLRGDDVICWKCNGTGRVRPTKRALDGAWTCPTCNALYVGSLPKSCINCGTPRQ